MTGGFPQPLRERRLVSRSSFMAALVMLPAPSGAVTAASAQVDTTGSYLQRMDRNGDGRVSLDEYLAWMSYAFDARDTDRDGVLSAAERPGGRGKPITRTQHQAALTAGFRKQDSDGDGYLSAKELAAPPR